MKTMITMNTVLLLSLSVLFGQFRFQNEIVPVSLEERVQFSTLTTSQFGDIYLIDTRGHEIYRLDSQGNVLNVNGGYGWDEAQFDTPMDLSLASGLDLFVADYNNHRVLRFDRKLNYLSTYPDLNSTYELSFPRSVIVTNLGEIFILNDENTEILRLNVSDENILHFGGVEYGAYAICEPLMMRINPSGIISVLEKNGRILQFDRFGTPVRSLAIPDSSGALGMTSYGNDLLVLRDEPRDILIYSSKKQRWQKMAIGFLSEQGLPIAIHYRNHHLYVLTDKNRITVLQEISETD